jgi:hypothetical protein
MRTPAVGVLLLVFICKGRGVSSPMQVEGHHIGGSRELGQEQRIRDPAAFDAHPALRFPGGMNGHDDAAPLPG